jgi:hypothetical protein
VQSPTYSINTGVGAVNINQDHGPLVLQLGRDARSKGAPGVTLTAAITPPSGFSGTPQWVQIINSFSGTFSPNGGTCTASGLDNNGYPYSTNTTMTDSPNVALVSPFTSEQISYSYTTYLQW